MTLAILTLTHWLNGGGGQARHQSFTKKGATPLRACLVLLTVLFSALANRPAEAAACVAQAAGAWNVPATWTACGGGVPGATDTVSIGVTGTPRAVTIPAGYNAQALSVSIGGTGTSGVSSLTLSTATSVLAVGAGGLSISGPANNNIVNGLFVNAGNATVNGNVVFNNTSANNRIARITITTGSLDVNGTVTMNATGSSARNSIVFTGAGNLFISGSFTLTNSLGTLTPGTTSTVTYDTGSTATVGAGGAVSYRNLIINKSGGTASTPATGNLSVLGDLNIQAGLFDIATTGTVAVGGNATNTTVTGELRLSGATGTKTFTGNVTIGAATGKWNNTANAAVTFGGSLTNNNTTAGSFVSGTGNQTCATNAARVFAGAGGLVFEGNLIISATRTNNTSLEVKGNLSGGSALTNAASQTLQIGGNANGLTTLTATAAGNIVNYNGTAAQITKNTTYFHLVIDNTTGPVTLSNNTNIQGNLTNNGNFDGVSGNRTVTFNGASAQSISGTAASTTLYRLTLNNANGLSLSGTQSIEVTNLLTLTNGALVTGANTAYVSRNAAAAIARTNGFVEGNLRWAVPTGAVTRTFPVGSGTTYAPVAVNFASITTAGTITISSTAGSHPDLANSGIDTTTPAKLNRYWNISNQGVVFSAAGYTATFNFVAGDVDAGATPTNFFAARYASAAWNSTTRGTATATSISITGETAFGEFAVGELTGVSSSTGRFNAYDPPPITTAGSVQGLIRTKRAGTNFSLTVVHLNVAGTALATFGGGGSTTVTIALIDGSVTTGAFTSGCWDSWISATPIASTTSVFTNNSTTSAVVSFTVPNAYRDVRVRMSGGSQTGCSGDRFAIRPSGFTVTSTDATNNGNAGAPAIKAGTNFNLTAATSVVGYDGTPSIDGSKVVGSPVAGTLIGGFGAASSGTGTATGSSFTYSEVGNFGLDANAVFDSSFTSVDQPLECTSDFSNTLVGGQYGCSFGSTAVPQSTGVSGFGRFIPDHFALSAASLVNRSASSCAPASTFSYMGEGLRLRFTLTAQNAANATTQNYTGSYAKLDLSAIGSFNLGARDTGGAGTNLTSRIDTAAGGSSVTWSNGIATDIELTVGINRAAAPDGPYSQTGIGIAPADTDNVGLLPGAFDLDVDGIGPNDHARIANTVVRFGRLQLLNAHGSPALNLSIPMEAQYWSGAVFQRNTLDSCTSLSNANFAIGNYSASGALNAGNLPLSNLVVGGTFSAGIGSLVLNKPSGGAEGSAEITVNLGSGVTAQACPAWTPAAAAAGKSYLQSLWCGGTYTKDPVSKATFGIYRSRYIFRRENY